MRRDKYRIFLIIMAIVITLLGIWCIGELNRTEDGMKGTFVYAEREVY